MMENSDQRMQAVGMLQRQAAALLLYQSVLETDVGQAFLQLLQFLGEPDGDGLEVRRRYGRWFYGLAARQQSWQDYLMEAILTADNPFSQQAQRMPLAQIPGPLVAATKQDLARLQRIYSCDVTQIAQWVGQGIEAEGTHDCPVVWSGECGIVSETLKGVEVAEPPVLPPGVDWTERLEALSGYYRQHGVGLFARYRAFRWQQGRLVGIAHPDPVRLRELVGYEHPQAELIKNTEFLLAGYPALHVLLYGSRGSGKSSLVKALVNEYGDRGLRLVQVAKAEMVHLPAIVERVRDLPQKFIIFVDDLSFEEDDDAFKALKVVLEGDVTARAQNVVVYATSNRRHLVREYFADRPRPSDQDEIQSWDTVQEKLSFSDRFGLTLTFEAADQKTYLEIVRHLAATAQLPLDDEELQRRALQWATRHNGRSGRTARQCIDFLKAESANSNGRF